jgi:peptide/nickel transport system substrate-binding protein
MLLACSSPATTAPPTTAAAPTSAAPKTAAPAPTTSSSTAPQSSAPSAPTTTSAVAPQTTTAPPAASGTQQYGGTLRIITNTPPLALGDPVQIRLSFGSIMAIIPCIEALVAFDNSGVCHGVLAQSWTIAPDGKSITFNLRKGVNFQDGTPFNAAAAKWNLDRMLDAKAPAAVQWTTVDVVDDSTVRINLKTFQNTILNGLESTAGLMVSPTAAQKNGLDWLKNNPVGTGPYMFKNYVQNTSVNYVRYDSYWGGKPFLDGVQFVIIADATTGQMAFLGNQGDVLASSTDANTADLASKGYKIEKRPGPMMCLLPDSIHPASPFANIKVRQAIAYSADTQAMAKSIGFGYWEPTNQLAASYQFGRIDASQVPYKYDPAKAKQLLIDAGYPNGLAIKILVANNTAMDPLQAIQNYLNAVGFKVTLDVQSFASVGDLAVKGWDNELLYTTLGATDTNYGAFLDRYFGANAAYFPSIAKPAGLTDLIAQVLATPDYNTEKTLSQKAVKALTDDCTAIPLFITPAAYALQKNVNDTGFDQLAGAGFRWSVQKAWLSK